MNKRVADHRSGSEKRAHRKIKEYNIEYHNHRIAVLEWPNEKSSKPPMVCFHGWLDNAASFTHLAEQFPEYRVIAMDFLGHGKSSHKTVGERYHYIELVPFIYHALKSLELKEIILIGHSMGAGACMLYTGSIGEFVSKLILLEGIAPMTSPAEEAAQILRDGIQQFERLASVKMPVYESITQAIKIRERANGLSEAAAELIVKRGIKKIKTGDNLYGFTWRSDPRLKVSSLSRMTDEQITNIIAQVNCPVLILLADQGLPQLAAKVDTILPHFKHASYEKIAGHHHLHLDSVMGVSVSMRKFLQ